MDKLTQRLRNEGTERRSVVQERATELEAATYNVFRTASAHYPEAVQTADMSGVHMHVPDYDQPEIARVAPPLSEAVQMDIKPHYADQSQYDLAA